MILVLCGLASGDLACGAQAPEGDDESQVGVSTEAIINGTAVDTDTVGMASIGGNCSSTILSNDWLLTAKHCVVSYVDAPSTLFITAGTHLGVSIADRIELHPSVDVALVHLSVPANEVNHPGAYSNAIYFGSSASLVGKTLTCYGYGASDFAQTDTRTILRRADLRVDSLWSDGYILANTGGKAKWHGDSGGPCVRNFDGVNYITGVASQGFSSGSTVTYSSEVGPEAFRDWVAATMGTAAGVFADPNYTGAVQAFLPGGYDGAKSQISGVGNDRASSVRVPLAWTAILWEDPGFTKNGHLVYGDTPVLGDFNDKMSSISVYGGVQIFADVAFSGARQTLAPGRYDLADLTIGNDALTSLTIPAFWRVYLYEDIGFSGAVRTFHSGDVPWIGPDWNDRTTSIVVEEPAVVYEHSDFGGKYAVLWPGAYDVSELGIANDSISSMRVPLGWTVTLYRDAHFTGPTWTYAYTASSIGVANDQASSIVVTRP